MILVENPENARNMLVNSALPLGAIGNDEYWMFDSEVWRISDGQSVYRSFDEDESIALRKMIEGHQRRQDDLTKTSVLREFCEDVEVAGVQRVKEDWMDIYYTYQRARKALNDTD